MALDGHGRMLWQRTTSDSVSFGGAMFGPPWVSDDMTVYRAAGETRIAIAQHHFTWWPSIISTWNGRGEAGGRFVNAGWIYELQPSVDDRFLFAAGVSNAFGGTVLAVLDADNVSGSSPPDGGSLPPCDNCPPGRPLAYFVVPWSDVAEPTQSPRASMHLFGSGRTQLRALQTWADGSPIAEVIVTIDAAFNVVERGVNDHFWVRHAQLERQGEITHSAAQCAWRTAPPVRRWLPQTGWQVIESPSAIALALAQSFR